MKVFVIAQHHGCFVTAESLIDSGIDDITLIVPGSQVQKYNKMYEENSHDPEFDVFKDFDSRIKNYIESRKSKANIQAYIFDDFDITSTVSSTLNAIKLTGYNGKAACLMAGTIVIKNFVDEGEKWLKDEFGFAQSRVYQGNKSLSMYHMIGLPNQDNSVDLGFFLVDMAKITDHQLHLKDKFLIQDAQNRKKLKIIPRRFNNKSDALIGTAISARQTFLHNLRAFKSGYTLNYWNNVMKKYDLQMTEEIFGYPYHIYGMYASKMKDFLPESTANKIIFNGNETARWIGGLEQCMEIIDT